MMGLGGHLAPPGSDFYAVCLIFGGPERSTGHVVDGVLH